MATYIDFANLVNKFEDICLLNPSDPLGSIDTAIANTKAIDLYYDVYPESKMNFYYSKITTSSDKNEITPIKCSFVPS